MTRLVNEADIKRMGRVALLMGGWSAEREVSLKSGEAVLLALKTLGVDVEAIDVKERRLPDLAGFARAFIMLHGRGGEDGVIQGALDVLGLPYTGTGVLGSALGMDKLRTKLVWRGQELPTPDFATLTAQTDFAAVLERLGAPVMVKPSREGSSIGMAKVETAEELEQAYRAAAVYDDQIIAERWIQGAEYTIAILGDRALPVIRLETPHSFYDYDAKYRADDTRYHCPSGLSEQDEQTVQRLALDAFRAVEGRGWGRVDLMRDEQGGLWLLEVNTVPGMTDHSLVPMAARAAGLSFEALVWEILSTSLEGEG
mgnify:CR=1 FL=1